MSLFSALAPQEARGVELYTARDSDAVLPFSLNFDSRRKWKVFTSEDNFILMRFYHVFILSSHPDRKREV